MVRIEISEGKLIVSPQRWTKVWTLRRRIEIPLEHVVSVRIDPEAAREIRDRKWLNKVIGTNVPRRYVGGTFSVNGRVFCDIRNPERTVVIELRNEKFARFIVEVPDPKAVVKQLSAQTEKLAA